MIARKTPVVLLFSLLATLPLAGCSDVFGDDDDETTVAVELREFVVATSHASAPNGVVVFRIENAGAAAHEFMVIRTELASASLPTEADGSYDENGPGTVILDEVEDIMPGETVSLSIDLDEGHYVLICNRVVGGMSHYELGMHAGFTVN